MTNVRRAELSLNRQGQTPDTAMQSRTTAATRSKAHAQLNSDRPPQHPTVLCFLIITKRFRLHKCTQFPSIISVKCDLQINAPTRLVCLFVDLGL